MVRIENGGLNGPFLKLNNEFPVTRVYVLKMGETLIYLIQMLIISKPLLYQNV